MAVFAGYVYDAVGCHAVIILGDFLTSGVIQLNASHAHTVIVTEVGGVVGEDVYDLGGASLEAGVIRSRKGVSFLNATYGVGDSARLEARVFILEIPFLSLRVKDGHVFLPSLADNGLGVVKLRYSYTSPLRLILQLFVSEVILGLTQILSHQVQRGRYAFTGRGDGDAQLLKLYHAVVTLGSV